MRTVFQTRTTLLAATALGVALATPAWAQAGEGDEGATASGDIIVTARRMEERLQDVPISITVFNQQQLSDRNITNAQDLAAYTPSLQTNTSFGSDNSTFSIRGFIQEIGSAPTVGVYFADVVAPRGGGVGITFGDGAGPGSFFDLQNVQVLKGPQGTLQGRNTTGGAVMLVPQKPTGELEGYVEGSIGNYDMKRLQAVLNVPVNDNIRVRLGVDRHKRDGYLINDSGIGPRDFNDVNYTAIRASLVIDVTPDIENYTIASYSRSNTNGSFQKQIGSPCDGITAACFAHGLETGAHFLLNPLTRLGYLQLQRQQGKGFYHANQDVADPFSKSRQWQVINTTTWKATDNLTVKNIFSYAEFTQELTNPLFGSAFQTADMAALAQNFYNIGIVGAAPNPALVPSFAFMDSLYNYTGFANSLNGIPISFASLNSAPGIKSANQSTLTEELQLQGHSSDNRLKWQAGAYFESSKPLGWTGQNTSVLGSCTNVQAYQCTDAIGALFSYISNSLTGPGVTVGAANFTVAKPSFRDIGLYAQASYDLSDKLTATAGFRYTWDRQTVDARMITNNFATTGYNYGVFTSPVPLPIGSPVLPDGMGGFVPNPYYGLPVPTPVQTLTPRCTLANFNPGPVCQAAPFKQTSKAPTWMIDLEYKPVDDVMLYAKYSRGYRTGGVKHDVPLVVAYYKPEKVDAFEAGVKSSFRGAVSGVFNATAFYNKFSNQQIQYGLSAPSGSGLSPTSGPTNAGKSRIWGIEADTTLNLFEGFRASAGYTYLNTKFQKLEPLDQATIAPYFVDNLFAVGDPLAYSPKHKLTVSGSYTLPLDESIGKITLGATFTHTSKMLTAYGPRFYAAAGVYVNGPNGLVLSHDDLGTLAATNLLDVNVSWTSVAGSPVDLSFFGTNVTKKKYYTGVNGLLGNGFETAAVGLPRMYGMRAKVHF